MLTAPARKDERILGGSASRKMSRCQIGGERERAVLFTLPTLPVLRGNIKLNDAP
jgi:hypothetical protein